VKPSPKLFSRSTAKPCATSATVPRRWPRPSDAPRTRSLPTRTRLSHRTRYARSRRLAFAPLYDAAKRSGDTALQQQIAAAYLKFANDVFDYDEQFPAIYLAMSRHKLFLLHGNIRSDTWATSSISIANAATGSWTRIALTTTLTACPILRGEHGRAGSTWAVSRENYVAAPISTEMQKLAGLRSPRQRPAPPVCDLAGTCALASLVAM